jgi:hypothetical protein
VAASCLIVSLALAADLNSNHEKSYNTSIACDAVQSVPYAPGVPAHDWWPLMALGWCTPVRIECTCGATSRLYCKACVALLRCRVCTALC